MRKLAIFILLATFSPAAMAAPMTQNSPRVDSLIWLDLAHAGDRVVAVGDRGNIFYSDDSGSTWAMARVPAEVMLTAVCFADDSHGWAVGHDAVVLATTDGGQTWSQQYSDPMGGGGDPVEDEVDDEEMSGDIYSDDIYSDDIYSDDPYGDGDMVAPAVDPTGAPFLSVWCDTPDHAIAVGGFGYLLVTEDGGQTWSKGMARLDNPDGWHLYDIKSLSGNDGTVFVTGEKGTLFRSRDHGANWERLESPYEGSLFGVTGIDDNSLFVYGLQGNVWLSRDLGESWQRVKTGISQGINDGVLLSDGSVVLVGNSGVLLTSHDGGSSLSLRYTAERESISAVLPRQPGGVLTAGAGGLRIIKDLR